MFFESKEAYHNFLNHEYEGIKKNGVRVLRTNGITPPLIPILEDERRSLDVSYNLPMDSQAIIDEIILKPAKKLFEELQTPQLVFDRDWLHMSLLVIMAAEIEPPFDPKSENTDDHHSAVREALTNHHPFEISFSRVIPFPGGILLGGFPQDFEVEQARERLRNLLDTRGLRRYERDPLLQIAHVTLVRWARPLSPTLAERVIEFTNNLDGREIWRGIFDTVDLTIGGYNASPDNTELLERFILK